LLSSRCNDERQRFFYFMEIWKKIPEFEHYEVSNKGRVKSLKFGKERILKPGLRGLKKRRYYSVDLYIKGGKKSYTISQLVAIAFLNHKPNGLNSLVVDHIDNNSLNDKLENLQLITQSENVFKERKGSSKYFGVSWSSSNKKWISKFSFKGNRIYLGCFNCEFKAYYEYKKKYNEVVQY